MLKTILRKWTHLNWIWANGCTIRQSKIDHERGHRAGLLLNLFLWFFFPSRLDHMTWNWLYRCRTIRKNGIHVPSSKCWANFQTSTWTMWCGNLDLVRKFGIHSRKATLITINFDLLNRFPCNRRHEIYWRFVNDANDCRRIRDDEQELVMDSNWVRFDSRQQRKWGPSVFGTFGTYRFSSRMDTVSVNELFLNRYVGEVIV